ncbi:MAG: putative DNA modification/repair radical SAM protein [Anaerolineae bacterium]|nr:putative DNA modification/repair radical SAM protein [Anaerolineae bacterium]
MAVSVYIQPDTQQKVEVLGRAAQYDVCGEACGTDAARKRDELGRWIYPAVMPDGKKVALLKILQTDVCEKNCAYCVNRRGNDHRRTSFGPDELARLFDQMVRARLVQGIFLSSGICGGAGHAMDQMLATIEIIRSGYQFRGYVHLKLLPGLTRDQVERAGQIATRVSVNLEVPNRQRLGQIASAKNADDLLNPMRWASEFMRQNPGSWAPGGQTTQFVVGAADESDQEILTTVSHLYDRVNLHRAYFSAFQPVRGTPLEDHPLTPAWREHRLYQCDHLFRLYDFDLGEFVFDQDGHLPREKDPKTMWADIHPEYFPVEINRADRNALLRVPGLGPRSVTRILRERKNATLCTLGDLQKIGAVAKHAAPYILLDGKRPPYQLAFA